VTAVARELHREQPRPWVLDDDLAKGLAGEEGVALATRLRAELTMPQLLSFSRWVCVRARWPEDIVEAAVADGFCQYVVLGAGLDSFAYRRGDLLDRLRVFEVDHPASQAWKRHRLTQLGVELPDNLVFAAVDFEHEPIGDGLMRAGFDFGQRAVFSWIGVTMYLSLDAIQATLSTISRCAPGTRLVLTYNLPRAVLDTRAAKLQSVLAPMMADLGEPMISLFTPDQIEQLLREHGFDEIIHFGPDEAAAKYFHPSSNVWFAGIQRLIAASVSRRD
jgi:methyltransferase (TIGR00027 family)